MSTPPINGIDLTTITALTPPIESIDLTSSDAPQSAATLEILASGVGVIANAAEGSAGLVFSAFGDGLTGIYEGAGSPALRLASSGSGYSDWIASIPPVQIQEVYRLRITGSADGLSDLYIGGISSWQATNQAGSRSAYLQAVIPAATEYVAPISARQNGDLIIEKGYKFSDGTSYFSEIIRSDFDTFRPDRGQRALTVTVSGYRSNNPVSSGSRKLTGIRSISSPNGKRRVRCDVDLFLKPGMTVTAMDESFVADYINYYVSQADKFCEVGER